MTVSIANANFDYSGRTWNLLVSQKLTHHRAKSDEKVVEENHGDLNRIICAIGNNKAKYGADTGESNVAYKALRIAYKNSIGAFKQSIDFGRKDCKFFSVPSVAIHGSSYICVPERFGVAVHHESTTDHGKSTSGINVKCFFPGTFQQACESILNLEVGERMLKFENANIYDLIDTINQVTESIVSAIKSAETLEDNTKQRVSFYMTCSRQNIRQKDAGPFVYSLSSENESDTEEDSE